MPFAAFLLIVLAAFAHSTWNLLAKRASRNRHFIWFSSVGEVVLLVPLAVWAARDSWPRLDWKAAIFLLATGILHLLYTESLRGYRLGDLSVIYPVARGTGPLFSFLGAIVVLGERPSMVAGAGALLVTCGILALAGGASVHKDRKDRWGKDRWGEGQWGKDQWAGPCWGIATGFTIACYTLVDGYSVKTLLLSPILVDYAGNLFRMIVLSGGAWRQRTSLSAEYRHCWREALGVAVLTPMGYILVLFAMRMAPVSHVAPAAGVAALTLS